MIRVKFDKLLHPLVPQCDAQGRLELPPETGLNLAGLIAKFQGLEDQVALAVINGNQAGYSDPVRDGDRVSLFSIVSGG